MTMTRTVDGSGDKFTQFFADSERTRILGTEAMADAPSSDDPNFVPRDPKDRCNRIDGICDGTILKLYDDVLIIDGTIGRVIYGAAGDRTAFGTYRFDPVNGGHCIQQWTKDMVQDLAPADPNQVVNYDANGKVILDLTVSP